MSIVTDIKNVLILLKKTNIGLVIFLLLIREKQVSGEMLCKVAEFHCLVFSLTRGGTLIHKLNPVNSYSTNSFIEVLVGMNECISVYIHYVLMYVQYLCVYTCIYVHL